MSYNPDSPANAVAEEIRENFRALKEDRIVAAATTTKLETARTINGVSFDGTENIMITQVNGKDITTIDEIPTSLPANGGDADTVDGKHAVEFAPAGYIPPNATKTTDGSMSAADKVKLDGIETGAQVNQNAFSNVVVNGTTIQADSQTDILELAAGTNIALTADTVSEKVTIAVIGQVASAAQADSATNADTATKLATAHTVNGVAFDGSADITIIAEANGGNADTATKLVNARTIATTGDVMGVATSFDGSANISIPTTLAASGVTAGSYTSVTVDAKGRVTAGTNPTSLAVSVTGNAATATKLATARTISLAGDATGSTTFDGSGNASITVDVTSADSAAYATSAGNADTLDGHHWSEVQDAIATNNFDTGHSFNANGYQKLGSGLIIQWGSLTVPINQTSTSLTFPIPFPTACFQVQATIDYKSIVSGTLAIYATNITANGCTLIGDYDVDSVTNSKGNWFAIGY
ncbi:hypothetical protein [Pelosinus sp. UFO1]|uniref:gp53-like domain-containing protein n=1 Tax=Pelosinus sp. UFO1 TaxID=484770 RepID=UPI0004D12472|nr:hypothetical protein [Pelosinus sp. UFO1]AIF54097.1 hypothetical protein UFO1_4562 [Pelosinus sp. UFO1]